MAQTRVPGFSFFSVLRPVVDHLAAELVAHHHVAVEIHRDAAGNAAADLDHAMGMLGGVQVRAADAAGQHLHQRLVLRRLGLGDRVDDDVAAAEDRCLHLFFPPNALRTARAQRRQHVRLEPRIALHPDSTAPRRMRQRKKGRPVRAECFHGVGQIARFQIMRLRIAADQQGEPAVGHRRQDAVVPQRRAFAAGRQVAALALAGIAEAHRHQRDLRRIVESPRRRARSRRAGGRRCRPATARRSDGPCEPGAWPMMTRREVGLNCTTGRGPAGRTFAQTVQARTSSISILVIRTARHLMALMSLERHWSGRGPLKT